VHAWAFPLAAWNFSSQNSLTLFLAWAKSPCKEHLTYLPISAMGGDKSSCSKFYNPQLQTMFNVLCCPASPFIPPYYYRLLKRILQSVFGPFHLELYFCPWQRSCEPLWSIGIYRHLGHATNEKERSKVSGDDTKAREGRKTTGSCCGSTILLLLLVWLLLLLVDLAPFLSILAFSHTHTHTHIAVGGGEGWTLSSLSAF
jgi:hypothetical protein